MELAVQAPEIKELSETEQLELDNLPASEIRFSVQGKGIHAGTPSVFLRTFY